MMQATLGSLFDGIGGWPLAAMKNGIKPLWASEIEAFPQAVTAHWFPDMEQLGDITKLNGSSVPPVDIVTLGSPCQDLSVAGKRKGLEGERSGLFHTAIKFVRQMRLSTTGGRPRFIIWENVPGAFSSNKGLDFRAVLEEIGEAEIPLPANGKWAEAGVVELPDRQIAWRTLDAQYWGVPQRRKRIFLVADFAGRCAAEVLFKPESVPGDITAGKSQMQGTTGAIKDGAGKASGSCLTPWDYQAKRIYKYSGPMATLPSRDSSGLNEQSVLVNTVTLRMRSGKEGGGKGPLLATERAQVLMANGNDQAVFAAGFIAKNSAKTRGIGYAEQQSPTLDTDGGATIVLNDQGGQSISVGTNKSPTLRSEAHGNQPCVLYDMTHADEVIREVKPGISPTLNSRMGTGGNQVPILQESYQKVTGPLMANSHPGSYTGQDAYSNMLIAPPAYGLTTKGNGDAFISKERHTSLSTGGGEAGQGYPAVLIPRNNYQVRRLTPTECERLQGLPDGYTDVPLNGKPATDTARYKALGNGMAQPCADFVIEGIARTLEGA